MNVELLAPAGDMEKLNMALYFGADAVYLSGKDFGMRAFCDNFDLEQLKTACNLLHQNNKKMYVTINISAFDSDFCVLKDYLEFLLSIKADGVIVSDLGIMEFVKKFAPDINIHLSTQANITNSHSANFFADYGVKRIVLARELNLTQIRRIRDNLNANTELEAFVHGAMCIAYSGRCLLSAYFNSRSGNRGQCAQSCRWEYDLIEKQRGEALSICEDNRGTYILSSRDLNMLEYLDKLYDSGISAFKIEGRAKSAYYTACITNAYRRAIDMFSKNIQLPNWLCREPYKAANRDFTTGFYFDNPRQSYKANSNAESVFCAVALSNQKNGTVIQMRNRFKKGDILQVLSFDENMNSDIEIKEMYDENNTLIEDAKIVCQNILLKDVFLKPYTILRKQT